MDASACPGVLIGDPFGKEVRNGKAVHLGVIAIQDIDTVNNVVTDLELSNGASAVESRPIGRPNSS